MTLHTTLPHRAPTLPTAAILCQTTPNKFDTSAHFFSSFERSRQQCRLFSRLKEFFAENIRAVLFLFRVKTKHSKNKRINKKKAVFAKENSLFVIKFQIRSNFLITIKQSLPIVATSVTADVICRTRLATQPLGPNYFE